MRQITAYRFVAATIGAALLLAGFAAQADTGLGATPARGLQQALATRSQSNLYDGARRGGFSLGGNFFSGRAAGTGPVTTGFYNDEANGLVFNTSHPAELENDQKVYALLLDGSYAFNTDFGSGLPVQPYVAGGIGMAMYGAGAGGAAMQGGEMVPLFRVGGGVYYDLGEGWKVSVGYKAGFTGRTPSSIVAGPPSTTDMQMVDVGMHFKF